MSEDRDDAGTAPFGPPAYGPSPYGQPSYGPPPYGQPTYGPPTYGPPTYGSPTYGSPTYGGHGPSPYGFLPEQPARPGAVITAAVLGLVLAALGLLTTVVLLVGRALVDDLGHAVGNNDPTFDPTRLDDVRIGLLVLALVPLAWTVVMVWGSVLALRGRSRVLLVVGASISVATTGLVLLGGLVAAAMPPHQGGGTGAVLLLLALFLTALATLVLPCLGSSAQFFATHRRRRALVPHS